MLNSKIGLQLFHISNIIDIGSDDLKGNIQKIVYPKEFNGDYIFAVEPYFTDALKDIIDKSGRKENIWGMLNQRLRYLEDNKTLVFARSQWFENPVKIKNIYFMKIKTTDLNIRISFIFHTYNNKEYAVLISAFTETKKSNAKTNNHSSHVATIGPIIDNIEEMFKNEQ